MRKNESMEQENMRKLGGISRGGKEKYEAVGS